MAISLLRRCNRAPAHQSMSDRQRLVGRRSRFHHTKCLRRETAGVLIGALLDRFAHPTLRYPRSLRPHLVFPFCYGLLHSLGTLGTPFDEIRSLANVVAQVEQLDAV